VFLAGLALAGTSAARAQSRDPAAGEALFQEGRRLMKSGDFAAACPKLEESLRLDPAVGTLVNLASCEEQVGRTATAWQHWRAAADQIPAGDKRRATAVSRAAALEKLLARLTIALGPGVSPEAEVKRDGVRLGAASLGLPLPVDPGKHLVVVAAPGREPREYQLSLKARESQTLTVEAGAEIKVARAPVPEASPERWGESSQDRATTLAGKPVAATPSRGSSALGWTLVTGGVVALGVAGTTGWMALKARKDADSACAGSGGLCRQDARDALDRDKKFSLVTDIAAGVGLVAASAGLYLLLRSPPGAETTAQVMPLPGGGAVALSGRF
jgi:hypothetical protein